MNQSIFHKFWGLSLVLALLASPAAAKASAERAAGTMLDAALDGYRAAYPEIRFVRLRDAADMPRLAEVTTALGSDAPCGDDILF